MKPWATLDSNIHYLPISFPKYLKAAKSTTASDLQNKFPSI